MKNFILIFFVMGFSFSMNAQTWKGEVQRISGSTRVEKLKIRPKMNVTIGSLLVDHDSVKENRYFEGIFIGGTSEYLKFKLTVVNDNKKFTNGNKQTITTLGKNYFLIPPSDSSVMKIALRDIDYLAYKNDKMRGFAEIGEPVILGSLLVMILSPLISYNFKENSFNTERYKKWAIGCTIGLTAGIAIPLSISSIYKHKKYQFIEGWPGKDAKVWKFRQN